MYNLKKLLPYIIISTMMISGCKEKSECNYPTNHVHLYTKNITDDITISKYLDSEYMYNGSYTWNEDKIDITSTDEEIYKLKDDLLDAYDNWDYIYYVMSNKHDYLEFYYHYTTTETYTTTDSDGKTTTHIRTKNHYGWSKDPTHRGNTGKVRLNHYRFYSYRIAYKDKDYYLEKSPDVDDIREVLEEYPLVAEDDSSIFSTYGMSTIVYKDFDLSSYNLRKLTPEMFDTFKGPDLSNTSPYLGNTLKK